MKILFSPAESKRSGGVSGKLDSESFLFPELFEFRKEALDKYQSYIISTIDEQLSEMFGIKDYRKFEKYKIDIFTQPLMKAIERYDGVAFDYLKYSSLDNESAQYIDCNTVIFSNLFGPILAGDFGIPEYKLKQGEKIGDFAPEIFYKEHFSSSLDKLLNNEPYLDLRAGFYNKFYKPNSEYITLKFLKNDKVVSHWAKAYRGIILNIMAKNNVKNMDDLINIKIEGLSVKEIAKENLKTEIIYDIQ